MSDKAQQRALLMSCHRNLATAGRIYTDFFQPRYDLIERNCMTEFTRFRTSDQRLYLMRIDLSNNRYSQIQHWSATYWRIEKGEKAEQITAEVDFRYLFQSEVELLLELCGFRTVEFDTDYADGRGFFVVAEKI